MKNILLVEPGYKNKYPPLSLMKISTYHKQKGDNVKFVKGICNDILEKIWDRVYITTLFTFDFDITVKTIRHYKYATNSTDNIFVGGILASLMPNELREATDISNIVVGQLVTSKLLGYEDEINIDELSLDYDILDALDYKYPVGDNYFGYTTRGCPNKCSFCAVPTLEPEFKTTNNIYEHVMAINDVFGVKKDLLLLDNNILYSPDLEKIVSDIKKAGFSKEPSFTKVTPYESALRKVNRRALFDKEVEELTMWLHAFEAKIKNDGLKIIYSKAIDRIDKSTDKNKTLIEVQGDLNPIIDKYKSKSKSKRYVDFNQGIDARLLTEDRMRILSEIPVKPLRIAFDSEKDREVYEKAVRLAHKYGIKEISNYMLYNFYDKPEELWTRLRLNQDLKDELGIDTFSFPMKYIPVTHINRDYIGPHWNKKFIRAIQAVLLVKRGIVSSYKTFFEKAFGRTMEEYLEIMMMPEDFIIYRSHFEQNGLAFEWLELYRSLSSKEKSDLLEVIKFNKVDIGVLFSERTERVNKILEYYTIRHPGRG